MFKKYFLVLTIAVSTGFLISNTTDIVTEVQAHNNDGTIRITLNGEGMIVSTEGRSNHRESWQVGQPRGKDPKAKSPGIGEPPLHTTHLKTIYIYKHDGTGPVLAVPHGSPTHSANAHLEVDHPPYHTHQHCLIGQILVHC